MAAPDSFSGNLGAGLSTLELLSSFLDQQNSSDNASDALKQQIQLALQGFNQRNDLINQTIGQTNSYQSAVANGLNQLGPYGPERVPGTRRGFNEAEAFAPRIHMPDSDSLAVWQGFNEAEVFAPRIRARQLSEKA